MDCELLNQVPALEQVNGLFRAPQTSVMTRRAKLVNNVNLKPLNILVKRFILDAQLGPVFGGYNTILKIKTEVSKSIAITIH